MHIHYNAHFLLDKEKDKVDARLRLRIRFKGQNVAFSVGFRINPERWSLEAQRCTAGSFHGKKKVSASVINRKLQHLENIVADIFHGYETQGTIPTIAEFRDEFNLRQGKTTKQREEDFFSAFDTYVQTEGRARLWTKSSYQKAAALRKHLKEFKEDLDFADLNKEGLYNLFHFFSDTLRFKNSTVLKQYAYVRWVLRWAEANEYKVHPAYKAYKPKLKEVDKPIVFLEWDELMKLYHTQDLPEALERVRDVFCFCCFTSLRYSDVAKLKRAHIFSNHIVVVTQKTNDSLRIDLNNYSRAILDKYKDEDFSKDLALPIISNQKMNEHLKDLGKRVGLDTPITLTYFKGNERFDEILPKYALLTTHAGRRTFISNALMLGIPADIVMRWTGHKDYKAMKPYIAIADRAKAEAMKLFNR